MPVFTYNPSTSGRTSTLTDGGHPAFLLAITEIPRPASWNQFDKHDDGRTRQRDALMYAWHFAAWESPAHIHSQAPEHLIRITERAFSPGVGNNKPSNAWKYTKELLDREVLPGETVNIDLLARENPMPCRIKIERGGTSGTFAKITELERARTGWPDVAQYQTPELRAALAQLLDEWIVNPKAANGNGQQGPPAQAPAPTPAPASQGLTTWGGGQAAPQAAPKTAGWS